MMLRLLLALALILTADPAAAEGESLTRYALLVSSNNGGDGRVPLRYAARDATAIAKVLTELGGVEPAGTPTRRCACSRPSAWSAGCRSTAVRSSAITSARSPTSTNISAKASPGGLGATRPRPVG